MEKVHVALEQLSSTHFSSQAGVKLTNIVGPTV